MYLFAWMRFLAMIADDRFIFLFLEVPLVSNGSFVTDSIEIVHYLP